MTSLARTLVGVARDSSGIPRRPYSRRACAYDEAEACLALGLDRPEVIERQMQRYASEGFPRGAGLAEACVILRRHTAAVEAFGEAWWHEIRTGSHRDQLSFDYVAWKLGMRYATFPLPVESANGIAIKEPHSDPAGRVAAPREPQP